ncbi:unnamed protein product [Alopecurus aequalis]
MGFGGRRSAGHGRVRREGLSPQCRRAGSVHLLRRRSRQPQLRRHLRRRPSLHLGVESAGNAWAPARDQDGELSGARGGPCRGEDRAGGNEYGQCGEEPERKEDGTRALRRDIPIPQRCALKLKVRQVAAGGTHSVVLTQEGHVWTWGQPWPPGDIKKISTPVRVQGLEQVRMIAVGAFHNLALSEDGILWAWGNNEYGQLGIGDTQPRSQPIHVEGLSDLSLVDIAAGGWHSAALTKDGEVYAWGRGEHGRLGFGDDKSSHMVPLKVQLLAGEDIVQVSCGGTHSVALTSDGRIFSYGRGDHGRLGYGRKVTTGHPMEVPINMPPPKSSTSSDGLWQANYVACGGRHTLAIVTWTDM